ncbi:MAG: histidinol dehydrogenase [Mangrovibacterium sp.]|nr:histidinol dehydrogenase [Mangrovibacterium sp.]
MKRYINPEKEEWTRILERPVINMNELTGKVQAILREIQAEGETAVRRYTQLFDGICLGKIAVSQEEIEEAARQVDADLREAIEKAGQNIRKFHEMQKPEVRQLETTPGVTCWQKPVPIEKVGLYIPGGSAPLFSTVLMLGIPAKIAGCSEIILCTPPDKEGKVDPAILFAAKATGITKLFKLGGVQAIGAMAYGAGVVPKVEKIFGPGNQYVMAAKQLVSIRDVAIDMPAGPSEVAVMADGSANPAFVASDLLSQAEHGPDSQVVLVTDTAELVDQVENELSRQLELLSRKNIAARALEHSVSIVFDNEQDMIGLINAYAPEHLIIAMKNYPEVAGKIVNAGSVFLGNYTPESAGDYASGTNHTLPTNGWARSFSGVNLDSFLKKITFQEISEEGIRNLGPVIRTMAAAEQLDAHEKAVSIRLKTLKKR